VSGDLWRQWQALFPFGLTGGNGEPPNWPSGSGTPTAVPFAESAERFAAACREFFAASRPVGLRPDDAAAANKAAQDFGNFLREHFGEHFAGVFQRSALSDGPALGLGRVQWLRAQRAAEAWNRLVQAQARLQRLMADTLREAATAFSSALPKASLELVTTEAIDRMYDRWIDCAEEAYSRSAHSDEFCDALSEYVNAGSHWRREAATALEESAKLWDLPTRGEINTLALRIRELEAQLAALAEPARRARTGAPSVVRTKPKRPAKRRSARPRPSP
jgi:hypothetical protein